MTLQETYILYKDLVYNLSLQYTQNVEDAEEITQDVFVAVHKKLNSFRNESEIKTWIYRIAINKSLDHLKAKKRKKRWTIFSTLPVEDEKNQSATSNFNHPGVEMEQKEEVAKIFDCINKLPDNQKSALILLKIEQLSQTEAAEALNMSTKAVESLFQRAKKNLEKMLHQNEGI